MRHRLLSATVAASLLLIAACTNSRSVDPGNSKAPANVPVVIDGKLGQNEWADAKSLKVSIEQGWDVEVRYRKDAEHLYFAFSNLKQKGVELFPEVLIAATPASTSGSSFLWLHASYNDCEAVGKINEWTACSPTRPGWEANNYPLGPDGLIEMKLSLTKLGLQPDQLAQARIAINLADKSLGAKLWPQTANLQEPATWGQLQFP